MAKTELEVRFTLPLDEVLLQHKIDAEGKAREAFVLELLRQGDISAGRAARLLNISRWDLSDLMYEAGISPFDDSSSMETLDAEVKNALKDLAESEHSQPKESNHKDVQRISNNRPKTMEFL